jgi:hypothetical protein
MKTKRTIIHLLLLLPLLGGAISACGAERYAGRFKGEGLLFEAQYDQTNYTGTITLGENAFKFSASEKADALEGSFTSPDGQFTFHAAIKGDSLTLTTGETRYKLKRYNPLAKGDGTGGKIKNFMRQQGGGFLGQFASAVAGNNGQLSQSASSAAFGTLAAIGRGQMGQPLGAMPQGGAVPPPQAGGQPVTANGVSGSALPSTASRVSALIGTWMKTDQNQVNGTTTTKVMYAVLRADGSMLVTLNADSARSCAYNQGAGTPQTTGAAQGADADVHARWSSNGTSLTITYDGGTTAQYSYEVRSNTSGSLTLHIQGADGSPAQEWNKTN